MKRLTVSLNKEFVMAQRGAQKLPHTIIAELLKQNGILIRTANFLEITADIHDDAEQAICSAIVQALKDSFRISDEQMNRLVRFRMDIIDETPEKKSIIRDLSGDPLPGEKNAREAVREPIPEKENAAEDTMKKIHSLLGAREFIALCDRVHAVSPLLSGGNLGHIMLGRSYLFSIDDGYGLTSALKLMSRLFDELSIGKVSGKRGSGIREGHAEIRIPAEDGKSDPLNELVHMLRDPEKGIKNRLLCLDISVWMDKAATPEFRDFLASLQRIGTENCLVFVFRVPYLEQEALQRIAAAIADVMTVETASFVPLTPDELLQVASRTLKDYGLKALDDVWELFQQRLADERSDGRFYGIKTVKKVVDEMVYRKYLAISSGESADDGQLSAQDLRGFVQADTTVSAAERLEKMVGIDGIRTRLEEIIGQIEFARHNSGVNAPAMHMRFVGNPGTGKTTVARIVGQMLKERGILSKGYFFEHTGGDFLGMYVGHTAPKTLALCRDAYGSVLFIDEAYTLADANYGNGGGYAKEAIDTLIAQMENHREDLVVIMAGYPREMERLMALNPGLAGRIPYELHFPNYTAEELYRIFLKMVEGDGFVLAEGVEAIASEYFLKLPAEVLGDSDFSNARFVRNLFERTWSKTVMRAQLDGSDPKRIIAADFETAARDDVKSLGRKQAKHPQPGFRLGMV